MILINQAIPKEEKETPVPEILIVCNLVSYLFRRFPLHRHTCSCTHKYILLARLSISFHAYGPFELFISEVFVHAICTFFSGWGSIFHMDSYGHFSISGLLNILF